MRPPRLKALLLLLFTLSGITGLMYEVAWSKYLVTFIGSTAYSHMIVLSTFMGGLAAGAYFLGKAADRSKNPLRLYATLELAIGVYCAVYPFLLDWCEKLFIGIAQSAHLAPAGFPLLILKFTLSAASLLVPTFFMGGTLPILAKTFSKSVREIGHDVAVLYAINSLGAILGAALAGFIAIRTLGLDGTIWLAAAMNIAIGVCGWLLSKQPAGNVDTNQAKVPADAGSDMKFSRRFVLLAVVVAAISGFVAMIYELTWIRLLANVLGSSTYSFSVMLIAFISGIALGSWIVSRVIRRMKNLVVLLALCQIGTAVFMALSLPFYERLPYFLWKLSAMFSNDASNFPVFLSMEFVFCFLIMIVPTTLSGMSLPIASRIASNTIPLLGKIVGSVFSVNTVGTVLGALVTGLLLIPSFGVKSSMEIAVLINALLGSIILFMDQRISLWVRLGLTAVLIGLGVSYRILFPAWNVNVSMMGVFRILSSQPPDSFEELKERIGREQTILWYREGMTANVDVRQNEVGNGVTQKTLVINGKADASTLADLPTQILLGQLPMMLLPDSGKALVVGLGSGITCGSMLRHPIRSLDCIEISSEVVECNTFFAEENHSCLLDPRLKLYIEDGITFLKLSREQYDYIVSEPSNPWIAGIGNLFTTEFFELCKSRLSPHGALVQWFHLYDMNDEVFKLVVRTMQKSFPYISIWSPTNADVVFMASMTPIAPDLNVMERKLAQPETAEEFKRVSLLDLPTLLSTETIADARSMIPVGEGSINTEKNSLLEFQSPVALFAHSSVTLTNTLDERLVASGKRLLIDRYQVGRPLTAENLLNIGRYHALQMDESAYNMAYSALRRCLQLDPGNLDAKLLLVKACENLGYKEERRTILRGLAAEYPNDLEVIESYARDLYEWKMQGFTTMNPQDMSEAIQLMEQCIVLSKGVDERYYLHLAEIFNTVGRYEESVQALEKVLVLRQTYEQLVDSKPDDEVNVEIANNLLSANKLDDAENYLHRAQIINPNNEKIPMLTQRLQLRRKGIL